MQSHNQKGNRLPPVEQQPQQHPQQRSGCSEGVNSNTVDNCVTFPHEPIINDGATSERGPVEANHGLNMSVLREVPEHLHSLALRIHSLNDEDLTHIAEVTDNVASRGVYSLLPYTGGNWFLPQISKVEENEKHWDLHCGAYGSLSLTVAGRRMTLPLINIFIRVVVIALAWFAAWNILPDDLMEPGGYVWDPLVLLVVASILGGLICRLLQIPPLVGVLWIAIMWNNIPDEGYLTSGIVFQLKDISSKMGLTLIMARAGYSLTIKGIRPHWKQSLMMATIPFMFESVAHGLIANKIFNYENNYTWAFLQGVLCSIVSPAVVVPGVLYLHEIRCSPDFKPLSLLLSSVGIEIALGVWAANFILGLLFSDQNIFIAVVLGPVQLIGGAIIGVLIGIIFFHFVEIIKREAERLPNGKYQKEHFYGCLDFATFVFLLLIFSMVFLGYRLNLAGGGCTMCVFFSSTVAHRFKDGKKELKEQKEYIGSWLSFLWDELMMPFLFALMGSKISVSSIFNGVFFPKAIVCLLCSTAVRLLINFGILFGSGLTFWEKVLVCVGYSGKATAQASIGPLAASYVAKKIAQLPNGTTPSVWLLKEREYANNVQQMSALYVMFMAGVASLTLVRGGMAVFPKKVSVAQTQRSINSEG